MSDNAINPDSVFDLTGAICDGDASESVFVEIDNCLLADQQSRARYLNYCWLHVALTMDLQVQRAVQEVHQEIDARLAMPLISAASEPDTTMDRVPYPPTPTLLSTTLHNSVGYFSSGWPLAYLIATVFFGVGLLIASRIYVSSPEQVAHQSVPLPSPLSPRPSPSPFVGRITGMVDCRWWADESTASFNGASIPLGRKYALAAGLMEITYDTGAKVILQGPVTYEVESASGGFLSLGKLTAKVEKKATNLPSPFGRGAGGEGNVNADAPRSTLHSPLFAVRTPTATVTDLGTEFGVEVDERGGTTSHVFCGSVEVQVIATNGETAIPARVLHENESAAVKVASDARNDSDRLIVSSLSAKPGEFVRKLAKSGIAIFDLVDVVAGGNGFSGRRSAGIDPSNGTIPIAAFPPGDAPYTGDGRYHRVETLPLVDGVFIPDGAAGTVQVDSAGHLFEGFPRSKPITCGYVWAGGDVPTGSSVPMPTLLGKIDYSSPDHALLWMHANKGITFDLEAIRQANPGQKVLRFRAAAGNTHMDSGAGSRMSADVWVLVDGRIRFARRDIDSSQGAFLVTVPISEKDRFLTLAATDAGNGISPDWIMFGDPRLELLSVTTIVEEGGASSSK